MKLGLLAPSLSCLFLPIATSFSGQKRPLVHRDVRRKTKPTIASATVNVDGMEITSLLDNKDEKEDVYDVMVCGAGPGGLLLASNFAKEGLSVCVVDPALDKPWPNNYGVWMDEAIPFGYVDCIDAVWKEVGVVFDEETPELVLDRPYGRVDRKSMKARLLSECEDAPGKVVFACAKATKISHFDDEPSVVTIRTKPQKKEENEETTTTSNEHVVKALLVTDCTGFSREFVQHDVKFDPGYQVTYGAKFRVKNLGPYKLNRMVLMDYSEMHLHDDPELVKSNDRFPSFVYVMPLAEDEIFMEETILVTRPGGSSRNLEARLMKRMAALGIEAIEVLEDERAAIPMGGADPVVPQRTLGFGATSSLVHPASGYMVARAMEVAPRVASKVAPKIKELKRRQVMNKEALDKISAVGWEAVWPADERRQRDFMNFGFELLCLLNPQELRDFFTGFFKLPNGLWEHFLSWRLSGIGHIVMGLQVWAQCIPRRFMPAMLIKSIPFIGNRLVLPFASRGGPVFTDSLYWDAQSGKSSIWEPETYYKYLDDIKRKEYENEMGLAQEKPQLPQEEVQEVVERAAAAAEDDNNDDDDDEGRQQPQKEKEETLQTV